MTLGQLLESLASDQRAVFAEDVTLTLYQSELRGAVAAQLALLPSDLEVAYGLQTSWIARNQQDDVWWLVLERALLEVRARYTRSVQLPVPSITTALHPIRSVTRLSLEVQYGWEPRERHVYAGHAVCRMSVSGEDLVFGDGDTFAPTPVMRFFQEIELRRLAH